MACLDGCKSSVSDLRSENCCVDLDGEKGTTVKGLVLLISLKAAASAKTAIKSQCFICQYPACSIAISKLPPVVLDADLIAVARRAAA